MTEQKADKTYAEAGPRALGWMYAEFWRGLQDRGMNRREALTVTVAYVRAVTLNWHERQEKEDES